MVKIDKVENIIKHILGERVTSIVVLYYYYTYIFSTIIQQNTASTIYTIHIIQQYNNLHESI